MRPGRLACSRSRVVPTGSCDETRITASGSAASMSACARRHHELHVGAIVLVDRRVVRDPDDVRVAQRLLAAAS